MKKKKNDRVQYGDFLKDSDSILDDTIKKLEWGPAPRIEELIDDDAPIPTTVFFIRGGLLMVAVHIMHCIAPETVQDKANAIIDYINEKGISKDKLKALKYGKGTMVIEMHDDVVYAISFYGKVSKIEMIGAHNAIKSIVEKVSNTLMQTGPLPEDFYLNVCKAFGVMKVPPQVETVPSETDVLAPAIPTGGGPKLSDIKMEIQAEIKKVRLEGFNVRPLEKALQIDDERAEKVLRKYRKVWKKGDSLLKRLEEVAPEGHEKDWERFVEGVLNLEGLKDIEKEIMILESKKRTDDLMRKARVVELRKEIEEIQARGYTVPHLFRHLQAGNVKMIEGALDRFQREEVNLKALEERGRALKEEGFDLEIEKLMPHFGNPEKIRFIEDELKKLEEELRQEEERQEYFATLQPKIKAWEKQGFLTKKIHRALSNDLDTIRRFVAQFEKAVKEMVTFEVEINTLRGKGFDTELDELRDMISDIDNVEAIRGGIEGIRVRISKEEKRRIEAALRPNLPKMIAKNDLIELIQNLPKGLPTILWGKSVEKIASQILNGQFGNTPNKKVVVRITRRWYYYDPDDPGNCLQPYSGDVKVIDHKEREDDEKIDDVVDDLVSPIMKRPSRSKWDSREVTKGELINLTPIDYPFELTEIDILEKVSTLPRGLPSSLWKSEMEELVKEILSAKYAENDSGDILVCINRKWYYGDPTQLGTYLQVYRG